jgi:pimeloyl-ACP methyl ester carboxylesterase
MYRTFTCVVIFFAISGLLLAAPSKTDPLPRRGFFGAGVSPVPDSLHGKNGIPETGAVQIVKVTPASSAEQAGLKIGDILLSADHQPLTTAQDLPPILKKFRGGDKLDLVLLQNGKPKTKRITLKPFPKDSSPDFDVIYESVQIGQSLRRIIITKPHRTGPLPVVVMLGGLGCYSLDLLPEQVHPYKTLIYEFARNGYVTVRVEKTGQGDSEGPPCSEQTFRDEVDGLITAIRSLSRFDYMDMNRLILLGHSMGGVEAPMVASEIPAKGIIAIATTGIGWFEYEMINQRRQLVLQKMDYDSIEMAATKKELAMHKLLVLKQTPDEISRQDSTLTEYLSYPVDYRFIQELNDLNLAHEWKKVSAKVLLVYGTADFVTAASEHRYARDMINSYHPGQAEYVEVPEMDHFFIKVPTEQASFDNSMQGSPNREFSSNVLPVVVEWAKKLTATP